MCDRIIAHTSLKTLNILQRQSIQKYMVTWLNTFSRPVVTHQRKRHELRFQQDGATCHTAKETMDVLHGMFGNNISHLVIVIYLCIYLWRYIKSLHQYAGELGRFRGQHKTKDPSHQSYDVTFRDEQCSSKSSFVYRR